jgi:anthranilate phosphoribosyltransferase
MRAVSEQNHLPLLSQHAAEGQELTSKEIEQAIHDLLEPSIPVETKAEFLLCLSRRGETARELADFALLLRQLALDPGIDVDLLGGTLVDTCGTGADKSGTFNISTAVAIVLAGAGIPVAKHGNRALTSKCGSADVLEALGVNIQLPPDQLRECIETVKIGFLFAPQYHKTFKAIQPVRQLLAQQGKRSIFNLLGPLVNPARPNIQIVGVFNPDVTELYASALACMKLKRAVVVHGYGGPDKTPGMDELSSVFPSKVSQLHSSGKIETIEIAPEIFDIQPAKPEDLKGGDARQNAGLIEAILQGRDNGPRRDVVIYNASLGFVLAGRAKDMAQGIIEAKAVLASGAAAAKLEEFKKFSNR